MMEVRTARKRERKVVSEILATAFAADPVVRWLLPTAGHDSRMFFALAAHIHAAPECADLALEDARPRGAALWDPPGHSLSLRQGLLGFSRLLLAMGAGFRRGVLLERAFTRARPPGQFWYLAQIGASAPGRGVGSALLEHRLSMIEGPAYLESSNVRNVPLYQRFGFEVSQEISLPEDGPALWTMLRP
jgi:GNAT superfamily N-acetyltransferase